MTAIRTGAREQLLEHESAHDAARRVCADASPRTILERFAFHRDGDRSRGAEPILAGGAEWRRPYVDHIADGVFDIVDENLSARLRGGVGCSRDDERDCGDARNTRVENLHGARAIDEERLLLRSHRQNAGPP
jgi:hypothetical protein